MDYLDFFLVKNRVNKKFYCLKLKITDNISRFRNNFFPKDKTKY